MRRNWVVFLGAAMLAGAVGSALLAPGPAGAVNRDLVELQASVNQILMGQQALQTAITQSDAVQKQLIGQASDSVNKLSGTMAALQKSVEDLQATSGARLDSMSTQIQGVSDNLQESLARMGKLNQQLTDTQNAIQAIDAKLASAPPPGAVAPGVPAPGAPNGFPSGAPSALPPSAAPGATTPNGIPAPGAGIPSAAATPPSAPAVPTPASTAAKPSADLLYSNALRDLNGKNYELSMQEFQDYLKYYSGTDLAGNAQFYLGEISFAEGDYKQAADYYSTVIANYPHSFKVAPARLKKGLALVALGEKTSGISELKNVVRLFPGTDEERRARAKLHELGVAS